MVADEMPEPIGPEFRKTFDEQNFGLPLKDALENLTMRVPGLDVRFFATAVLIQRETGGNLSEILENLAHVVRERFKILRQVRVYTAHGRMTGYVLLALPAVLCIALAFINPDHMNLLFRERMGQMLLMVALGMQTIGYFWIQTGRQNRGVACLMPLLAFVFGSILVGGAAFALMPNRAIAIDRRLEELTTGRVREDDEDRPTFDRLMGFVKRVGEKAPRSTKELGSLRLRLVQAGYRRDEALTIFFGIRVVFALGALRALRDLGHDEAEHHARARRPRPRLHPPGHGAGAHGQAPRAPHPPGARRRARPARRQRRSRARPRPGAHARRQPSSRSRIRTCPTSCGS